MNQSNFSSRTTPVRVLIVDDHLGTATTLARAIAQVGPGLEVIPATSGEEALERVKHVAADILITDMIMPGMTGLQLLEKLQNNPAGRPTFSYLITAYDVPGLRVTASQLHFTEVFTKPINPERICQVILQAVERMSKASPASNEAVPQKQFTILIADDQPDNLLLLTRYLEAEGYNYIKAKDGLETLEKLHSEIPDLVLLDVNMPNKDGFTVLEEIRADPAIRHIPVIILTAARQDSITVQFGLNLGADDYITKPFDRRELIARIRTKLRSKESEDRIRQQLAAVLQCTADAVLLFDAKACLSLVNPTGRKLFRDDEAKLGESLRSGAGYDSLLQLVDQALLSGTPFSGEVMWPDQRVFSASITPIQGNGCVVVLHDVTYFKHLEHASSDLRSRLSNDSCNPISHIP
jgi:two-component system alkaline phosphatase synthesis response regulator PhoP